MTKKNKALIHDMEEIKKHCTASEKMEDNVPFKKLQTIHEAFDEVLSAPEIMEAIKGKTCHSSKCSGNGIGEVRITFTFGNDKTAKAKEGYGHDLPKELLRALKELRDNLDEKVKSKEKPQAHC